MRTILLVLVLATGALLATFVYQQLAVEGNLGPAAMLATAVLGAAFLALLASWLLYRTRHRELVGKVWLALFTSALAYAVVDVVAGKALIKPLSPPLVADAHRHHKLVPDSYAEFRQRDFAYVQRVNHLGLRGAEVAVEKPAGTFRILMLGDSFTMGKGVEDAETFSVVLQDSLQAALAACGGRPVEVVNAGVDSYAPLLERIYLERELLRLSPDLVVVNLDVSDLAQEQVYRRIGTRGPDGSIVAVPQTGERSSYERIRDWTQRNLFFTRLLLYHANRALGYRDAAGREVLTEASLETVAHTLEGDVDRSREWGEIFESIAGIRARAESNGAGFLLTLYPWAHQVSDTQWVPGRYAFMPEGSRPSDVTPTTVRALAAAQGIELADLFPAFRAAVGREKLYFDHDMHWTPAGHRVMAAGLAAHLLPRHRDRWCAK